MCPTCAHPRSLLAPTPVRELIAQEKIPEITNQELQQTTGDANQEVIPLFEKVLTASDTGRTGRLILPKRCAEEHFPPIDSAEGMSLPVFDFEGKKWVLHFRFWPNNNSRMYVLEGFNPCMQSMKLQAGDIVTFGRIESEDKIVMGCKKVSTPLEATNPKMSKDELDSILATPQAAKPSSREKAAVNEVPESSKARKKADLPIKKRNSLPPPSPSGRTTKHPRHRTGCRCIVCVQPPSGIKHKASCDCAACLSVRRRSRTLTARRRQKQTSKGPTKARKKRPRIDTVVSAEPGSSELTEPAPDDDETNKNRASSSQVRTKIFDLNLEPEISEDEN